MKYLLKYGITEEQIEDIKEEIEKSCKQYSDSFIYDSPKIMEKLDVFTGIGVNNIYGVIMASPTMFLDTVESIKERLYKYSDLDELARLINEDASNLELVGLLY